MTLGERIRELRRSLGLKQAEFADQIGGKEATVPSWETGNRNPSDAVIVTICNVFEINKEWLANEKGPMRKALGPDEELDLIFQKVLAGEDPTIKAIIKVYWSMPDDAKQLLRQAILDIADQIKKDQG